jgi:hypothetical protein
MSMSRESRTLLILVIFAIGAVAALGYLAQRYGKMMEGRTRGAAPKKVSCVIAPRPETVPRYELLGC